MCVTAAVVQCRHNTMANGMLLGGLACIGCAVTPAGPGRAVLAAVGKFGISGSFGIASVYTRCGAAECGRAGIHTYRSPGVEKGR